MEHKIQGEVRWPASLMHVANDTDNFQFANRLVSALPDVPADGIRPGWIIGRTQL